MTSKHFLLPWEKECVIECSRCGGRISTGPLWHWEVEGKQALEKLQSRICHLIDSAFLEKVHALSENDWKSYQTWKTFKLEIDPENPTSTELLREKDGLTNVVWRFGVISLVNYLTEKEFETLLLLMSLHPLEAISTPYICQRMKISHAYLSNILKEFKKWGLMKLVPGKLHPEIVKGRERGRKMFYRLAPNAREVLDRDLQNYDFFKEAVVEMIKSLRERFPTDTFRKDLEAQSPKPQL